MRRIYSPGSRPPLPPVVESEQAWPGPGATPHPWESFRELHNSRLFGSLESNQQIYFE